MSPYILIWVLLLQPTQCSTATVPVGWLSSQECEAARKGLEAQTTCILIRVPRTLNFPIPDHGVGQGGQP